MPDKNRLTIDGLAGSAARPFTLDRQFRPLPFSDSGVADGEVVFAGYGLSVPEGNGGRYNSYDGFDVKYKIVLLLRFVPEAVEPARRAQLNRYAGLRYKAMMARERGARMETSAAVFNGRSACGLSRIDETGSVTAHVCRQAPPA